MDRLVASKAATDHFTRTRWWWIRHAPVRVDEGRIYGQRDLPCDCSEAGMFASLAALLPQDAIWVTSHLSRTVQTAQAIQAAGHFTSPEIHQDKDFAEQHLGDWQGLDRQSFLLGRQQEPDSFWYAAADERAPNGESFVDVIERVGAVVARVNRTYSGKDIVAVAHGGTIRAAIVIALRLPPRSGFAFTIDNCSLTRLDHYEAKRGDGWRVPLVNQRPLPASGDKASGVLG
jgi:broad specificity phosphatase PhoE